MRTPSIAAAASIQVCVAIRSRRRSSDVGERARGDGEQEHRQARADLDRASRAAATASATSSATTRRPPASRCRGSRRRGDPERAKGRAAKRRDRGDRRGRASDGAAIAGRSGLRRRACIARTARGAGGGHRRRCATRTDRQTRSGRTRLCAPPRAVTAAERSGVSSRVAAGNVSASVRTDVLSSGRSGRGSSNRRRAGGCGVRKRAKRAEREGFEPSVEFYPYTRLAGVRLRPLGHLSGQRSTSAVYRTRARAPAGTRSTRAPAGSAVR